MAATHQEIFERYLWAGAMTRNADALAELFTPDGVIEAPLMPPGRVFPRRMEGHSEIRAGLTTFYQQSTGPDRAPDLRRSRYVLHDTVDPDVFIVEIDTAFLPDAEAAPDTADTMSLVQIFRIRDGKIALLRDYFAPEVVR